MDESVRVCEYCEGKLECVCMHMHCIGCLPWYPTFLPRTLSPEVTSKPRPFTLPSSNEGAILKQTVLAGVANQLSKATVSSPYTHHVCVCMCMHMYILLYLQLLKFNQVHNEAGLPTALVSNTSSQYRPIPPLSMIIVVILTFVLFCCIL